MALIILGKTVCFLCGKPLMEGDDMVAFPAFLKNTHELGRFSDAALHRMCFERAPQRQAVEALFCRFEAIWESRPRELKTLEEIESWGREAFKNFP